jgi:succinylglutamate desuccinylase
MTESDCPAAFREQGFIQATLCRSARPPLSWSTQGQKFYLLDHGVVLIEPSDPADNCGIVLSAGVHGDETSPVELLESLAHQLFQGILIARRPLLLLIGNPPALRIQKRFVQENLNRLFKKDQHGDSQEAVIARDLMAHVTAFRQRKSGLIHFDMHTAIRHSLIERFAIFPVGTAPGIKIVGLSLMQAAGIEAVVTQTKVSATFSGWTHQSFGALSFTLELGKVAPFGQNDLSRLQALAGTIEKLVADAQNPFNWPIDTAHMPQVFDVAQEIIHTGEGFILDVDEDVPNFTEFSAGDQVWHDSRQVFCVDDNIGDKEGGPAYLLFPNSKVSPGQRAGLLVKKTN